MSNERARKAKKEEDLRVENRDPLALRRIARAEIAGDPEWKGMINHARRCLVSRWCRDYVQVFDEVMAATRP
jgi:hypothetical protein